MRPIRIASVTLLGVSGCAFACQDLELAERIENHGSSSFGGAVSTATEVQAGTSSWHVPRTMAGSASMPLGNGGMLGASTTPTGSGGTTFTQPLTTLAMPATGGTSTSPVEQSLHLGGAPSSWVGTGGTWIDLAGGSGSAVAGAFGSAHAGAAGTAQSQIEGVANGGYAGTPNLSKAGNPSNPGFGGYAGLAGASSVDPKEGCPFASTKSQALRDAEPEPSDRCARVTNVILFRSNATNPEYAFAFTNGEIHIVSALNTKPSRRVDTWVASGETYSLQRSPITAMLAPSRNYEGALSVGYPSIHADAPSLWYAGRAGVGAWLTATQDAFGTVMGLSACPFHGGMTSHRLMILPSVKLESLSGHQFSSENVELNQHLQLAGSQVTSVEVVGSSTNWYVLVGTATGELYRSNVFVDSVSWNETTQSLNRPVTWTRLTSNAMPDAWVIRIAVHPVHSERLMVVFGSSQDAVWYSEDAGTSWSNRFSGLPTTSNSRMDPPVLGASFNPFQDHAAYVVTSQTSYFSEDDGISWHEW